MNRPNPAAKHLLKGSVLLAFSLLLLTSSLAGVAAPASSLLQSLHPLLALGSAQPQQVSYYGYGAHVSEAVQDTNASSFQDRGVAGQGVNVAIIAYGFAGYDAAEIPAPFTRSFREDGGMGSAQDGTFMAEVVADMAPAASLTLIAIDTPANARLAANWVATMGFDIAVSNMSIVEGPFDGSDPVSRAVAAAANSGVLWVQSSGINAQRHWEGPWLDANGDGFRDFARGATGIPMTLLAGTYEAYLSWYQSAGNRTAQDYDLCLYSGPGPTATLIAQSAITQAGNDPPADKLVARIPAAGTYELRIKAVNIDPSQVDYFQLYSMVPLPGTVAMPAGSLPVPAMLPEVFTVGSIHGTTLGGGLPDTLELFSGQGPTLDDRLKPDMVAHTRVTTSLEDDPVGILNSAPAAAHVGGAAALLLSEDSSRSAADIRRVLLSLAIPLPNQPSSPNNQFGHGKLRLRVGLDTEAPSISFLYPVNSTTITERTPRIQARITDVGSGVDPGTIVLKIDGVVVNGWSFSPETGSLVYPVTSPLGLGPHLLTLDAKDFSGNAASTVTINFRVALPLVEAGLHMFSLPYSYPAGQAPSPTELLGGAANAQVARWWPGDAQYHYYPDSYASLEPPDAIPPGAVVSRPPIGLGYFVKLNRDTQLEITGNPLAGVDSYEVNLSYGARAPRGWNMIGCPFTSTVDWGSVQFITNGVRQTLAQARAAGVTDGIIFGFQSTAAGGYYTFEPDPFAAVMQPFKAYWIRVWRNTTLVIPAPAVAIQQAPSAAPAAAPEDGWRLQLVVSAGQHTDPATYVGVSPAATEQYSTQWAISQPPPADGQLRASLVERNWGERSGHFAQVIKPASGRQSWDLEVASALPGAEVTVRWPQLNATVPSGYTLILQDLDTGEEVYMRTCTGYSFNAGPSGGVRHLRIVASPEKVGGLALSSVSAQGVAGGGVAFTYAVSQPAEITAEVRNISGVLIRRLATQQSAGGQVELLVWNGRNERGSKVPAGRYLVSLTARSDSGQTMQAIRPFEVLP